MRAVALVLLGVLLTACSGPSDPSTAPSTAGPSTPVATPNGSVSPVEELLALLPTTLNGVAMTRTALNPVSSPSPRIFLKVIARVGKTPPDARLVLAFGAGASVYAMRVADTTGSAIGEAFLAERMNTATVSAPPTEDVGGKQVTRLGSLVGNFLYATGDTFYFVEATDDDLAAALLTLLP